MLAAINDWLNADGAFLDGVSLLKAYGSPSKTDLFMFSLAENSVLRDRLRTQLAALVAPLVKEQHRESVKVKGRTSSAPAPGNLDALAEERAMSKDPKQDLTEAMLPVQLRPLRRELKEKHAALNFLRGGLMSIPDGMHLRRAALAVADLYAEIKAGWFILETWRATGHIMSMEEKPVVKDDAEMLKRRNNLRTYISRHETGKRKTTPEKLAAYHKEIVALDIALDGTA